MTISYQQPEPPLKVYVIQLNQDGSPIQRYTRLPPPFDGGYVLRFVLPLGSDVGPQAVFCTNYADEQDAYERTEFRCQKFQGRVFEDRFCDIAIEHVGAFQYHVEHDDSKFGKLANDKIVTCNKNVLSMTEHSTGYFVIDPMMQVMRHTPTGIVNEMLTLDGIVLQSVIPKWLGPIDTWPAQMANAARLGYNMIHYAPMQVRGESNSPYSIYDQLALADELFDPSALPDQTSRWEKLGNILKQIETDSGVLAVADVVLNHTANNSPWLQLHPEAGYNLINSPHLVPAFEVDEALIKFSEELESVYHLPCELKHQGDLDAVLDVLRTKVLPDLKLWQYYVIDAKAAVEECRRYMEAYNTSCSQAVKAACERLPEDLKSLSEHDRAQLFTKIAVKDDHPGKRFGKKVIPEVAVPFVLALCTSLTSVLSLEPSKGLPAYLIVQACSILTSILDAVNVPFYARYDDDMAAIVRNVGNTARYERLEEHGPKRGRISAKSPIMTSYFTRLPLNENTRKHPKGALVLANNGWIWGGNPLQDFAAHGSAYLRRDVIIWGDCVKLRYGTRYEDNPWLWEHMTRYVELMARYFHGFRLDNCHSTPIALAEHVLDAARRIRPNLYLTAELFTGDEEIDITYVSRLGIHSLVRESMRADDVRELSRLVHRYGGVPIGSFDERCRATPSLISYQKGPELPCLMIPVQSCIPHAIFMDCTHDNETPHQRRMAEDTLPNAAVVSMACCAIGSVRGYDELYPKLLDLVRENRRYRLLKDPLQCGIGEIKQKLQTLHTEMALDGFNEIFVHQEGQYILVHRQCPDTRKGYLLIAHSYFKGFQPHYGMAPTVLRGTHAKYLFGGTLEITNRTPPQSDTELLGLEGKVVPAHEPFLDVSYDHNGAVTTTIRIPDYFPPGSILMFETQVQYADDDLEDFITYGADRAVAKLDILDLNVALYRSDREEEDTTPGHSVYNVPGVGRLPYAGIEGFMWLLRDIIARNDLAHPFCNHLREGFWSFDYLYDRLTRYLDKYPNLEALRNWYAERVKRIKRVANFLAPKLFALLVHTAYHAMIERILDQMPPRLRNSSSFARSLALCSVQLYGYVPSTGLSTDSLLASLAAGLPHFATHHMRCWGRDTFISLRGIFLLTGNMDAARSHILAFASSIRHGLIPNLLDGLRYPRYNARDATWWFLQAVKSYCEIVENGTEILDEKVARRFPKDDRFVDEKDPEAFATVSTLAEIIQEICQRHANGIHFREWNAGPKLDHAMQDPGFQVDIQLDPATGFISGGNSWNCGTWMDKMGDSEKAGNFGKPTTPRDGAAVEIIGLVKSTVTWLHKMYTRKKFPYAGVELKDEQGNTYVYTYSQWSDALSASFEKNFYVPVNPRDDVDHVIDPTVVNRRGIYKDTFGSNTPFADYQFRPNFTIAMVVAPELFKPQHAMIALEQAKTHLLGPIGMRTLDPADWAYRGDYNIDDDSSDPSIAHGANYHQGPEWIWCTGYFLRAYDLFDRKINNGVRSAKVRATLSTTLRHMCKTLQENAYAGLPELTNSNGQHCNSACETQAWSAATILELLDQVNKHVYPTILDQAVLPVVH